MSRIFRAAIIGTGRIGATYDDAVTEREDPAFYQGSNRQSGLYTILPINHATAYQATPGFELVAAANRGEEKLRDFGARFGVQSLYTDAAEMLRREQLDVVSICTQSPEKVAVTVAAAEAGVKTIVVEKAMATSMAEADEMIAACERNGVRLVVNHPFRFSPLARLAKAKIDAGEIGDVGTIIAYAGGGMLHIGSHTFDMFRFLVGDAIEISATVPDYAPESDLPASGTVRFANGVTGFFDQVHRVQAGFEVRGTHGSVAISSHVGDGWITHLDLMYPGAARPYPSRVTREALDGGPHDLSMTQRLFKELHDTMTTDAPFISTGHDGAAALEMGLACFVSHLSGGPVSLPLKDRNLRVPNL